MLPKKCKISSLFCQVVLVNSPTNLHLQNQHEITDFNSYHDLFQEENICSLDKVVLCLLRA